MIWTTVDRSWWRDWFDDTSPDLTTQDYFLWGHMKSLFYETPEESEEDQLERVMARQMYTQLHKLLPEVNKQKFTHPPSYK